MPAHDTRIRVRYAETDQMGVVYYANYLVWMEVARVEYCKWAGFSYEEMERRDGVFLAVVESFCRYLYPARFDQEVILRTSVSEVNSRFMKFDYVMTLAEGRRLATGYTKHIFLRPRPEAGPPATQVPGEVRMLKRTMESTRYRGSERVCRGRSKENCRSAVRYRLPQACDRRNNNHLE